MEEKLEWDPKGLDRKMKKVQETEQTWMKETEWILQRQEKGRILMLVNGAQATSGKPLFLCHFSYNQQKLIEVGSEGYKCYFEEARLLNLGC